MQSLGTDSFLAEITEPSAASGDRLDGAVGSLRLKGCLYLFSFTPDTSTGQYTLQEPRTYYWLNEQSSGDGGSDS